MTTRVFCNVVFTCEGFYEMSRQFSIPTVLRMVPNVLLCQFFERLKCGHFDIDWTKLGEREVRPIHKEILQLSRLEQDRIEGTLRSIFDLACDSGIDAIFEAAAKTGDFDLPAALPSDSGAYAKAMWTWLNRPEAFDTASLIHQVENISWWRKRCDLPKRKPNVSDIYLACLSEMISGLLQEEQGRGHLCTIEHFSRSDGIDYFFVYPDDYVQNVMAHDDEGILAHRTFRPTLEIVFAFNSHEGSLELFSKMPPRLKSQMENQFSLALLETEIGEWKPDAAYELNHLKNPSFELATDPEDRVLAYIRKLRLAFKNSDRRILLEVHSAHDNIHTMIDECLNRENISLNDVNLTLATFTFEFLPLDGRKAGTMTFDVAWPNSCGLRNQSPDRIELAQKYLKRWKIDVGGTSKFDPQAVGMSAAQDR
jgi:hypothetical protein